MFGEWDVWMGSPSLPTPRVLPLPASRFPLPATRPSPPWRGGRRRRPGWVPSAFSFHPSALSSAFSLIELLIVTAILGVVIGVLGACIAGGLRVWDTARAFQNAEAGAVLGLEVLERDLMNAVPLYAVPFNGNAAGIEMAGPMADAEGRTRLGTIRYRYDRSAGRLLRAAWAFPGEPPDENRGEALLTRLRGLDWEFCVVRERSDETDPTDDESAPAERIADWSGEATNLPAAVRVRLTLDQDEPPLRLERTIVRAVGGGGG
jgi:prepilin-type N-terminal cleavage/methylation domain-containing protein